MTVIERIEGEIAVTEDGDKRSDIHISLFDGDIREGDVVVKTPDGRFRADKAATEKRRRKILDLQNSLWK